MKYVIKAAHLRLSFSFVTINLYVWLLDIEFPFLCVFMDVIKQFLRRQHKVQRKTSSKQCPGRWSMLPSPMSELSAVALNVSAQSRSLRFVPPLCLTWRRLSKKLLHGPRRRRPPLARELNIQLYWILPSPVWIRICFAWLMGFYVHEKRFGRYLGIILLGQR